MSDIAIVGMACRFAGAPDLQSYWDLTLEGRNAFGPVPADRWSSEAFYDTSRRATDKTYAPAGAFIDDVRSFPALLFGIPPRRVEVMDPQQRMSLEVSLQAIHDAGVRPSELPERTGVYMGVTASEFRVMLSSRALAGMMASGQFGTPPEDPAALAAAVERVVPSRPFTAPGALGNMISAAVAQQLNLHGPAYTVDAACSSAVVAVFDAVAQLRSGQVDTAIAGGVYLQLTPEHYIAFSRIGAMSEQGLCLPFDARADGFVQGDGCGVVVLMRLQDAVDQGHRIYATIRGVGLNNDGRGDGPMAPVLSGQVQVIQQAWRDSGADAGQLGYVEAHGTGTDVGDAIELTGLRSALGDDAKHVQLGSSKANVGHTMSAAGVAGLIRATLAVHHGMIPPMSGFESAKAELALDEGPFSVPTEPIPWKGDDRVAALSSFGFGGTNGHLVLGTAPKQTVPQSDQTELVRFSAGTEDDLRRTAARIAATLRADDALTVAAVARAWGARPSLEHRAALVVPDRDALIAQLDEVAGGGFPRGGALGQAAGRHAKLAMMFPGQGAQRIGMLRGALQRFPVLREALERSDAETADLLDVSICALLYPELRETPVSDDAASAALTNTANCQPVMAAVGLALWELLASLGVRPTVTVGHSLGELPAAAVGGVLTPRDAVRFAARRGRAMSEVRGDAGAMAALRCDTATAGPLLAPGAVLANDNHPAQVVVSGSSDAVDETMAAAERSGVEAKRLAVSHAFHSPLFADLPAAALLADTPFSEPGETIVVSCISAAPYASADDARAVLERHAVSPVRFQEALSSCVDAGADVFLQVGAGGPLASFARRGAAAEARAVLTLGGVDDDDSGASILEAIGRMWVHGVDLDTRPITAPAVVASLPPMLPARQVYWPIKDVPQRALKLHASARVADATPAAEPTGSSSPAPPASTFDKVAEVVANVSSYPRGAVRPELSLIDDLGFDSLMVADLATGLAEAFPGLGGLPQELLLDRPTVQAIADHVQHAGTGGAAAIDDGAPVHSYAPVFRPCPLPEGRPGDKPLNGWTILLAGERDVEITAALKQAGAQVTRRSRSKVDVVVFTAPMDAPPSVAAALAGEVPTPDASGALLELLERQAQLSAEPGVVVLRRADDPWAEGLSGVVRAMAREWSGRVYKSLHFDEVEPAYRAARLVQELISADRSPDVSWSATGRAVSGLQRAEAPPTWEPGAGDRVLITGGTRGIGLKLARRLVAAGAEVLLVGRSVPEGLDLPAVAADVTDRVGLVAATAPHAPFTAVVHAAGVLADGAIGEVDPEHGALARRAKRDGFLNAIRAGGPGLKVALGLGSWAGRFGNRHQAHYAAANAAMAGMAGHAVGGPRVVVAEFGPWADSEMVRTIPAAIQAAMRAEGVDFVTDDAGLDAVWADLQGGEGALVHGRNLPWWSRERATVYPLSTDTHPYLLDHAIGDIPVLPLAAVCDLVAETAGVPTPFEVADLKLFSGITVADPVEVTVTVRGERAEVRIGEARTLAYRARVRPAAIPEGPAAAGAGTPPAVDLATFYRDWTFHGPLLQGLKSVGGFGDDFARGEVRSGTPAQWIPETTRTAWAVDPLALDSAFQLGALVVRQRYDRGGTPVALRRLVQIHPPAPGLLSVEARFDEASGDRFVASFWMTDAEGTLVAVAEGAVAEMRQLGDAAPDPPFEIKPEWIDVGTWPEVKDLEMRLNAAGAIGIDNPYFHVHEGTARDTTVVDGRELVNFSSYNYLGLSGDPRVVEAVAEAVQRYGTSVSASRVASGERPFHGELEAELAAAQGVDDALVFTAGHMTNVNVIGHLMKPPDLVLHDELIHDSILQGIKLSGAGRRAFRHEDPEHLERLLRELRPTHQKCLIVVEGVYSMDGDLTALPAMVALKERYGCLLMVDEAHSFGVVGATGRGIGEHFPDFDPRSADLWMGTLSKSLSSCGGWIAGSERMIRYLRYTAPGFVFSAGITPANGVAALASLRLMLAEPWRVEKLQANARTFHDALTERGVDTGPAEGGSAVVPAVTGNSMHALLLSQRLRYAGINVQPIVYPAVADDAARLRFFLSSTHEKDQLVAAANTVADTLAEIRAEFPA